MGQASSSSIITIEPILDKIISTINTHPAKTNIQYNEIRVSSTGYLIKNYEIPYDIYVQYLYREIENVNYNIHHDNKEGFTELVYSNILSHLPLEAQQIYVKSIEHCSSHFRVYATESKVSYGGNIKLEYKNKGDINALGESVLDRIKDCGSFIAIPVDIEMVEKLANKPSKILRHRNMIFIENIPGHITINYYEPHGSVGGFSETANIHEFLENLVSGMKSASINMSLNTKIYLNVKEASCPTGMQSITAKYDIGYCVMFSLFWLYSVLSIVMTNISTHTYEPSSLWIKRVETYFNKIDPPTLYNIVVAFAGNIFNNYIAENYDDQSAEILQRILKREITNNIDIKKYLVNTIPMTATEFKSMRTKEKKEIKARTLTATFPERTIEDENDPELSMEAYEQMLQKEREEEQSSRSLYQRITRVQKTIDENCDNNEECISGCCKYTIDPDTSESYKVCVNSEQCGIKRGRKYTTQFSNRRHSRSRSPNTLDTQRHRSRSPRR